MLTVLFFKAGFLLSRNGADVERVLLFIKTILPKEVMPVETGIQF